MSQCGASSEKVGSEVALYIYLWKSDMQISVDDSITTTISLVQSVNCFSWNSKLCGWEWAFRSGWGVNISTFSLSHVVQQVGNEMKMKMRSDSELGRFQFNLNKKQCNLIVCFSCSICSFLCVGRSQLVLHWSKAMLLIDNYHYINILDSLCIPRSSLKWYMLFN